MQPGLRSVLLHAAAAEQRRRDAVERRRLVQADEGIGVEPVPADAVPAVDDRHAHVGVVDQRIRERHARGAGPHHEIVGFDSACHWSTQARRRRRVHEVVVNPRTAKAGWTRSHHVQHDPSGGDDSSAAQSPVRTLKSMNRLLAEYVALAQRPAAPVDVVHGDNVLPSRLATIGANPAEALDRAAPLAGSRFEHRLLTGPQVALLATQVGERSHPAYGLMILFLAYTGLRRAEVQGLEVRDLMLTTGPDGAIKGSIRVARTKTRRHSEWVTGTSEDEAVQAHRAPAALARRADGRLVGQ